MRPQRLYMLLSAVATVAVIACAAVCAVEPLEHEGHGDHSACRCDQLHLSKPDPLAMAKLATSSAQAVGSPSWEVYLPLRRVPGTGPPHLSDHPPAPLYRVHAAYLL